MFILMPVLMFAKMTTKQISRCERYTPQPVLVCSKEAVELAKKESVKVGGDWFVGGGKSMLPLFPEKTVVVTKPIKYDDVKKGMTLVYKKKSGKVVAHAVIGEDGNGYIVQGTNNEEPDAESVNENNLIGVVVKAYTSAKV